MSDSTFEQAYRWACRAARVRSAASIGECALAAQDREDLEQEAQLTVWRALRHFDSSRASLRTFVERVVATRFASLKRAARRLPILEPVEEHLVIGLDGIPGAEFRLDFNRACAHLNADDRRLAGLLTILTPTEASRAMGISRSTVYEGIRRIRVAFESAGYVPSRRHPK